MFNSIKEWLFSYSYTKYLVKLNKYKKNIELPLSDQLAIIHLLKGLGAENCKLELYQKPKKESWNINMSQLDISKSGIIIDPSSEQEPNTNKLDLSYEKCEHVTISLANSNTIIFEVSDTVFKKLFYTKLKITLPVTLDELIEESKRLATEERLNKK